MTNRPSQPDVPQATQQQIEELLEQGRRLEGATPEEILRWAVDAYFPKLTMATAFGPEGCLLISMLARIEPRVYVFNLETGYQFAEIFELRNRLTERFGVEIAFEHPAATVEEYERANGGPVYRTDPDRCCRDRKIEVLHRVARRYRAWMSSIRRDQSPTRAGAPIVGWDRKFGLVKISPLANWTKRDVWKRILDEKIPYNPMHDRGYPSVGCWPCTRSVADEEDERAGRWSGTAKTECGLHTDSH